MSVLLVDSACRAPLLAAEPGLTTLIKLSSRLPGYSQPWQGERRTLAARTLCSCIQRDGHVRSSLITSGPSCCEPALAGFVQHFDVHGTDCCSCRCSCCGAWLHLHGTNCHGNISQYENNTNQESTWLLYKPTHWHLAGYQPLQLPIVLQSII